MLVPAKNHCKEDYHKIGTDFLAGESVYFQACITSNGTRERKPRDSLIDFIKIGAILYENDIFALKCLLNSNIYCCFRKYCRAVLR